MERKGPCYWQTSTCTHVLMFHIWKHTVYWQISTTMCVSTLVHTFWLHSYLLYTSMYVQYLTHNIQWCMYVRKYVQYNDINIDVVPILPVSASTLTDLQVFRKQDSAEVLLPVIISCLQFGPHQPLHCKDAPPHGNRPQPSPIALPSVSIQDLSWDSVFSLYKIQGT